MLNRPLNYQTPFCYGAPASEIDGRDGGGAAEGSTGQNILREVLHYRPPSILGVIRSVLVVISVLVVSAFFSVYWLVVAG